MDSCTYHIQLRGQILADEVNRMSPLHLQRETGDTAVSQFAVTTDQSGLIGLLRHLHRMGYVLESFDRDNHEFRHA